MKFNILSHLSCVFVFLHLFYVASAQAGPMDMDGQFAVSASGAATYSIPIQVPPGTGGMEPRLELSYNSQAGNGLLGMGWNLAGLSAITSCPRTLAQDGSNAPISFYSWPSSRYCLDGQRLMAVSGTYGNNGTEYRTERESFTKVVSYGTPTTGPTSFKAWTKDGLILEFGTTADSAIEAQGRSMIAVWAVKKVSDAKGNYFTVSYAKDNANGDWYPTRIDYTGNSNTGLAPNNSVQFSYEGRPDIVPMYQGSSVMKTMVRLKQITMTTGGTRTNAYQLNYAQGVGSQRTQLRNIVETDGAGNAKPATSFGWQDGTAGFSSWQKWGQNSGAGNYNLDNCKPLQATDVNGDGLPDLVCSYAYGNNGDATLVRMNQGTGFSGWQTWGPNSGTGFNVNSCKPVLMGDINGDGLPDLVCPSSGGNNNETTYVRVNHGTGFSGWQALGETDKFNSPNLNNCRFTQAVDINGDGSADLLCPHAHSNTSDSIYSRTSFATFFSLWGITGRNSGAGNFNLDSCKPLLVMDVNGDGMADIVCPYAYGNNSDSIFVRLNDGEQFSSWQGWGANSGAGNYNLNACKPGVQAADVNGDGLPDLICAYAYGNNSDDTFVRINNGTGFSGWQKWGPNSGAGNYNLNSCKPLLAADVNGDGLPDVVCPYAYGNNSDDTFVRINQGIVPDLMTSANNGLSVSVQFTYKTLMDKSLYTKGSGSTYPIQDIQAPMYVVSSVRSPNGIGGTLTTNHTYGGLKLDARSGGRGLLGFAWQEVTQVETGLVTRTEFRQDWPYLGLASRVTVSKAGTGNGGLLKETVNTFGCMDPAWYIYTGNTCPISTHRRYFPHVVQTVEKSWDLNGAALPTVTSTQQFDTWGNATQVKVTTSDGYEKITTNTYNNDADNWRLGQLLRTRAQHTNPLPSLTRTSAFAYGSDGLLAKEVIEPDNSALCLVKEYTHDAYGNRTSITTRNCNGSAGEAAAPTGDAVFVARTDSNTYDARGQFVVVGTNALGHSESKTYDAKFGTLTKLTGPNGLSTTWQYDGFGRKTLEARADGMRTRWEYFYCSGVHGGTAACPTVGGAAGKWLLQETPLASDGVTQNGPRSRLYFDALGREIRAETQGFDGVGTAPVIYKDTQYDSLGRPFKVSRPYYSGQTAYWATLSYDVLGRVIQETQPDASTVSTQYNGLTVTVTDPVGRKTSSTQNSQGQVVRVVDAQNNVMTYVYDALGNLTEAVASPHNVVRIVYNVRGHKTGIMDPDMGYWTYVYNALGELVKQTDGKSQVATLSYDRLGRVTRRSEADLVSNWYYDTYKNGAACTKGIGKLCQAETNTGYNRSVAYDALGRETNSATTIDVPTPYVASVSYDAHGRIATQSYPSGLVVKYVYTALSHLKEVRNNATNALYWRADSQDAEGRLLQETYGNNVGTRYMWSPTTGRLSDIISGVNGAVQDLGYQYDSVGNLTKRIDYRHGFEESFVYDSLYRLTSSTRNAISSGQTTTAYSYDAGGNLLGKSDLGTYSYYALPPPPGSNLSSVRPHAVSEISLTAGGKIFFEYDANGSMTSQTQKYASGIVVAEKSRKQFYTSFNMPQSMSQGTISTAFSYGPEHQRVKQVSSVQGATIYVNPGNEGALFFEKDVKPNGHVEQRSFINAGGQAVAIVKTTTVGSSTTTSTRYVHRDHLGSVTAITDENGTVLEKLSYEPFGKRRFANGAADPNNTVVPQHTDRGYTGHEMLDEIGLIHMNGRVYDPLIGRFLSADPFIQSPYNLQSYNRYSYVLNNPLGHTDPSGYFSIKKHILARAKFSLFPTIKNAINFVRTSPRTWNDFLHTIQNRAFGKQIDNYVLKNSWAYAAGQGILTIFTMKFCGGCGGAAWAAYYTHLATGSATAALKAGVITYLTTNALAGLNMSVGTLTVNGQTTAIYAFGPMTRFVGTTLIGGVSAKLQGGSFEKGAMLSAASAFLRVIYDGVVGRQPFERSDGDWGFKNNPSGVQDAVHPDLKSNLGVGVDYEMLVRAIAKSGDGHWESHLPWYSEASPVWRWTSQYLFGTEGVSRMHDIGNRWVQQFAFAAPGTTAFQVWNVATVFPSIAITYGAAIGTELGIPSVYTRR